jgi:hypothetical protein
MEPLKPARPWDLLNPHVGKVSREVKDRRMAQCLSCAHFQHHIKTCKKCGCFMPAKTTLPNASCPIGKWGTDEAV